MSAQCRAWWKSSLHCAVMPCPPASGGAVVAGRQATLTIDGQFYAPGGFTLAASQGGQVLRWEEPRNRYDQLFWQAEHFAWCIGQGVQDSPLRPLSRVLQNLQVMDEVRRQVGAVFNEER